jgi:transaldolase
MTNALHTLDQLGQSIWFDNISRQLITSGNLKKMVDEGLQGVTSNPTIFDKAIAGSADYDEQIRELADRTAGTGVADILRELMIRDIQMAAEVLKPVFVKTKERDGYVSVEVNPHSARNTRATIEEVRLLWNRIDRANLMVKIPATREGLPAIEQMTREGININVTLIFSRERYREVTESFLTGLEKRLIDGRPIDHIASVASVFVSRVDTLVDELLGQMISEAPDKPAAERPRRLLGTVAIANTRLIYQDFKEIFGTPRYEVLRAKGAKVQRPLWGSTGTKNPAYSDLKYVENLIGAQTVNTVPPSTYAAILNHLSPEPTIEHDSEGSRVVLKELSAAGVDLNWVMQKLENNGVASFEKSFDDLLHSIESKQVALHA